MRDAPSLTLVFIASAAFGWSTKNGDVRTCIAILAGFAVGYLVNAWKRATAERERTILALLRDADGSGADIAMRSNGRIGRAMLYTTLASMEKRGLIVSRAIDMARLFTSDPPMMLRYYSLADAGRAAR